jgi:hypothetical protein
MISYEKYINDLNRNNAIEKELKYNDSFLITLIF